MATCSEMCLAFVEGQKYYALSDEKCSTCDGCNSYQSGIA